MINKLFRSSFFRFLERGIVVVTSLLLTPFFIEVLGSNDYGLWLLVVSVMGWFNVVDLGFPEAVQRQIIQALEIDNTDRVNTVFSTGLVLFGVLGLFSVAILVGLAQVPAVFGVAGEDQLTLVHVLLILSVNVLGGFMMNSFHGLFSGMLRFDIDANLSSLNAITKALLVFWLIPDLNIWGAVVATLTSDIVTNILKVIYAKRLFPRLQFNLSLASMEEIRALFSYSKHLVVNGIAATISSKYRPLLITHLFDLKALAVFSIAGNLIMHTTAFVTSITGVFLPVFNQMFIRKQDMERIFIQTSTINMFVATVLHLSLVMFGKVFIILWVGAEFESATGILYLLVLPSLCASFSSSANSILLAQANHKLISVLTICSVFVGISLAMLLGSEFGLIGIAIGGAINGLIFSGFAKIALFHRYNDFEMRGLYMRLIKSIVITFGLGYLGAYSLESLQVDTWVEFVFAGALAFPIICLVSWVFLLDKPLKLVMLNFILERLNLNKHRF